MPVQRHQDFLSCKLWVNSFQNTRLDFLRVDFILRAKQGVHVRLDKIAEHHFQCGRVDWWIIGIQKASSFVHIERS